MTQVCSIIKCSAVIAIQKDQDTAIFTDKAACEKCYGKPICAKCDRLLHAPLPAIPSRQIVPNIHTEQAYKKNVIHTYLPKPKPGYTIKRVQFFDGEGGVRYEYVSRRVQPEKRRTHARLVKRVRKFFRFIQRGSQS